MIRYILYETSTGKITATGYCQDDDFSHQAQAGQSIIEGTVTNENYVIGGVPTYVAPPPPTQEELNAIAERNFVIAFRANTISVLYEIDKRLRVLEGAPSITLAQFKQGLKTFLGL